MSLKLKLLGKIKSEARLWHKGELSDYAREIGYSSENAGRRLRELENEKLIKVEYVKGCAMYKSANVFNPITISVETKPKLEFGNRKQIYELRTGKLL